MRPSALIAKLAWRNLRRHLGGALLLGAALVTATTALTMALCVGLGAQAPWDRAFAETDGAQVLANSEHLGILAALTLRGIAVSTAQPPFPRYGPGLAWVSTATSRALAAGESPDAYQVELRLSPSTDAPSFVTAQHIDPRQTYLTSWLGIRQQAMADIHTLRTVLLTVSALLVLLTSCAITVLVATRMSTRLRQIGTFKASGVTPGQAVAIIVLEYLYLAAAATAIGLFAGARSASLVTSTAGPVLGTRTAELTWPVVTTVAAAAMAVVALAAVGPAWQAIRATTLSTLAAPVRPPRSTPWLGRLAQAIRLPPAAALGTRSVARRPSRTLLTAASTIIAVATATAALAAQATFIAHAQPASPSGGNALVALANQSADNRLRAVVYLFAAMFVILGAINLLLVAAFAARDTRHNHAVLRAIGFTPRQTARSLVTTQLVTAVPAALAGLPIGMLLFRAVYEASTNGQSDSGPANPPIAWLAGLFLTATALAGLLAAAPAAALARNPIAPTLTTD
jgi:putative ABC transport system permease protein